MNVGLFFYRYRSYTPLPLLAVGIILGHPTTFSIYMGLIWCVLGESLRIWGVHTAGPLTRMTAGPGGNELVTHGPYAYLRNPLYLGNVLIYTGVAVMTGLWWLAVASWIFFQIQYALIIREEETFLREKFGGRYVTYMLHVRRFYPRIEPYVDSVPPQLEVSTSETFRSERRTFQAIVIAVCIMTVMAYLKN